MGDAAAKTVKVLMIGDVIGESGLKALFAGLGELRRRLGVDLVVANGENAAAGVGITAAEVKRLRDAGVDVITSGNHVWEKQGATELLNGEERLLRPANYPPEAPGHGLCLVEKDGYRFAVLNLQGREGMSPIDCPFRGAAAILDMVESEQAGSFVVVDFHAESNEEKEALAFHLDGRVSAFAGTHTHVQTADQRILPQGTGYLGDLGMTGPADSVIGVKIDICVRRSLTQIPIKMETAEGQATIRGALFTIDAETRHCLSVEPLVA
ncbi:MAG TPA: TIGR00282 family metallophosphoesterase [Rectinemataceae bacterium]|nr:TIGR00282 family metallophosphoesterase [Rectinemataceae bacterium]